MRFSKKLLRIAVLVAILSMCVMIYSGAQDVNNRDEKSIYTIFEPVDYSMRDFEWCRWSERYYIPEETLHKMTTEALVETLCRYPLLGMFYAMSNNSEDFFVEPFASEAEITKELKQRNDKLPYLQLLRETLVHNSNATVYGVEFNVFTSKSMIKIIDVLLTT